MPTTGVLKVDPGTTTSIAIYQITEDATTKDLGRATLNDSSGSEVGTSSAPFRIDPTGTTPQPVSGTVSVNALPSGTNIIGKFTTDQTTHGTTDLVGADITQIAGTAVASSGGLPVTQKAATSSSATLQNAVSATGNGSALSVDGMASVIFEVTGTFTATVTFQGSRDGGTTYYAINALRVGTPVISTTTKSTGLYESSCAGMTHIRATVTWTSGTSVTVKATSVPLTYGTKTIGVSTANPSHASSNGTPITATTSNVIAAPSAGNHIMITRIHASNGGTTATWVSIRDGASGTKYYPTYLPLGGVLSPNLNLSGPLHLSSATALDIVLSAAGSVEYTIDYFTVAD